MLVSRSHLDAATDAYVDRLPRPEEIACGSALKFCLIAEGSADLYPRLGPTSEWDVAAGHAVLIAAGGAMRKPDGSALRYGQGDFRVPGFIATRRSDGAELITNQSALHLRPIPLGGFDGVSGSRAKAARASAL